MTNRQAKRAACGIVNALIESYRSAGQPYEDLPSGCTDQELADANRLCEGLCEIQGEMFQRAGSGYPARYSPLTREEFEEPTTDTEGN